MDVILLTLKHPSLAQMVLAWVFVAGYALALGGMLGTKGSLRSGVMAALAAAAFCVLSDNWVHGALLILFAIAGMALFVVASWVLTYGCAWLLHRGKQATAVSSTAVAQPAVSRRPIGALRSLRRARVAP